MKRFVAIFVVLVAALSVALYLGLRDQQLALDRPSGGSATIEGTEVGIVSKLPTRIASVRVVEGDRVEAGQPLVTLDCTDPEAALADAEAAVRGAELGIKLAEDQVELARVGVGAARKQTSAARSQAAASREQVQLIKLKRQAAERDLNRLEQLVASGSGTEQALDKARDAIEALDRQAAAVGSQSAAARAQSAVVAQSQGSASVQVDLATEQVEVARAGLERARAGRIRAKASVAECTLTSPIAGVVQTRAYEPGELVMPGTRILTVVNVDEVTATFYLPNAELAAAKVGGGVKVVADAYPDKVFQGTVRHIGAEAEFTPRNVQTRDDRDRLVYPVEIAMANDDRNLRPGMAVEVTIPGTGGDQ